MADVEWTERANEQLGAVASYIELYDVPAAGLMARGNSLAAFPHRGRPAPNGPRELVNVGPYILRYRVKSERVFIPSVRHDVRRPLGVRPHP